MPVAIVGKSDCPRRKGEINVVLAQELETARKHADNGIGARVEIDRSAKDIRGAAETALPKTVADNDRGRAAGTVFVKTKRAAEVGVHAEKREQSCGDPSSIKALGLTDAGEGNRGAAHTLDGLEAVALVAPVDVVLVGHAGIGKFAFLRYEHDSGGIAKGERVQQDSVYDAEDRSVCADAEGQSEDSDRGKRGALGQKTESIAKIL